ncbi:ROK family protein [Lentisphaera profundi]|uniref:Phosphohexomutase n=1 Tax=Lentisphaera profundi TaxID=1658616 RepID=A0ABY7VXQ9_9BACT|nr:type I phosphomannose isomerase catalytic subunit [Lentisphaera profundi]WDE99020.1 ROK family protein [Lentisphaera profundi]
MIATIDLGGTQTKYGLIHNGEIVSAGQCEAKAQGPIHEHLNEVKVYLEDMCQKQDLKLSDCRGLGILSTGLVNNQEMRVLTTNGKYDDSKEFDFKTWAQDELSLEVRIENDARGALLGEWHFGAAYDVENAMMITLGTGIGTAVISEGRLLKGSRYSGGNLGGHILVNSGGRKCTCGAVGCLEAEASGWALPEIVREHEFYQKSSLRDEVKLGFKELFQHADQGDACAIAVREHCLKMWGEALVSYIHLFDPEKIVIGGGVMHSAAMILASFDKTIKEMEWRGGENVKVVQAKHTDNAGILGAAALFQEHKQVYAPLFFEPVYKSAIWGGSLIESIGRQVPVSDVPTGESWEIVDRSDEQSCVSEGLYKGSTLRQLIENDPEGIVGLGHQKEDAFPLLLKIIDAEQDLSLQVHPDEESCKHLSDSEPKTEMWYVLDHQVDAQILAGIKDDVSQEEFRAKIEDPSVRELMHSYTSEKGSAFFIKATTMHAIGGGNLIYEIQQNSNTTYRVSDWGRLDKDGQSRELHVEQAMTCLEYKNPTDAIVPYELSDCSFEAQENDDFFQVRQLTTCQFFQVAEFKLKGLLNFNTENRCFHTLYAVDNDLKIIHSGCDFILNRGQSCLIPARAGDYQIESRENTTFIHSRLSPQQVES